MQDDGNSARVEWIRAAMARFEGDLVRYARQIIGDGERARDVVQDTFLKLCREDPAQLDGHLAAWLYRVCRNASLDVKRKEQRMSTVADERLDRSLSETAQPDQIAEQRDSAGAVYEMLERLPVNQQEVVRLKFQGGLSYREIADITGLSVSNVGFLLHRALTTLRGRLKPVEL